MSTKEKNKKIAEIISQLDRDKQNMVYGFSVALKAMENDKPEQAV